MSVKEPTQYLYHPVRLVAQGEPSETQQLLVIINNEFIVPHHVFPPCDHIHVLLPVYLHDEVVLVEVCVEVPPTP